MDTPSQHIGVVGILGIENTEEKDPPNGSFEGHGRLGRAIVPDVLPVDIDKLNHTDTGDRSGSATTYFATCCSATGERTILRSPLCLKLWFACFFLALRGRCYEYRWSR